MARTGAVWGIDLGQCALKALRCRAHDQDDQIEALAFDYIEHPKILSQAGANPDELVAAALEQFLARNTVRGDRVAISVSGQSGLARFIKLPPVESKKIPDIVRYEARQQIPFDLNDVIWDYQQMGGGAEEEGFALETEVGLFAMKRDAVFRALEPFQKAGIDIDYVQLTPLALYNFVLFDQLNGLPAGEEYDPDTPPESIVVLSMGTDSTDLVVTNGYRVWQRSIPIGGNHFTKALTQELKLTFAKAEHLKRNAAAAQDPKAVFQAMRPVFGDLLTELQRSLGYFTNIDRTAKIGHIVALGNTIKLPGLRRYLTQNLGFEVKRLDQYRGLQGAQVLAAPAFKDNMLAFGVCYGLALQGLGKAGLRTSLLPQEIVKDRLIRQKKPWALAAAAAVLLGCTINFATGAFALKTVDEALWSSQQSAARSASTQAGTLSTDTDTAKARFDEIDKVGNELVSNIESRVLWLELLRAVTECLPRDDPNNEQEDDPNIEQEKDITKYNRLYVTGFECRPFNKEDMDTWHKQRLEAAGQAPAAATGAPDAMQDGTAAPEAGLAVMITGHHYHNRPDHKFNVEARFVREQFVDKLRKHKVSLPPGDRTAAPIDVTTQELGISHVVLDARGKAFPEEIDLTAGASGEGAKAANITVDRFNFRVYFCWQPTTASERAEKAAAAAASDGSLPDAASAPPL